MNRFSIKAATGLAALGLGLSPAAAATFDIVCTGVAATDSAAFSLAIASAALPANPDRDTILVHGDCVLVPGGILSPININTPIILTGDGCASITRTAGTAVHLSVGSDGTLIEGLRISAGSHAIANQRDILPVHNPDDITVRRNHLIAGTALGTGRCVLQWASAGIPFSSDVDRCTGTMSVSIPDHWLIEENLCESTEIGIFVTGNDTTIRRNDIRSRSRGMNIQNNARSTVAAPFGGGVPGLSNIVVEHNVVTVDPSGPGLASVPIGIGLLGLPFPPQLLLPAPDCNKAVDVVVKHNCVTIKAAGGFSRGFAPQKLIASDVSWNNATNTTNDGEGGVVAFNNTDLSVLHNKLSNSFFALYHQGVAGTLEGTSTISYNHVGRRLADGPQQPLSDFTGNVNEWSANQFCFSDPYTIGVSIEAPANHPSAVLCDKEPAQDCSSKESPYPFPPCFRGSSSGSSSFAAPAAGESDLGGVLEGPEPVPHIGYESWDGTPLTLETIDTDSFAGSGRDR